ncbi:hypothetical protein NKG94_11485 [Micromonospora sp. M12]
MRRAPVQPARRAGRADRRGHRRHPRRRSPPGRRDRPAAAARSGAQARADADRLSTVTAGWARRLEEQHRRSSQRHAAELGAVRAALAEVWAELDRRVVPGSDPTLARLRAAHNDLLAD